MSAMDRKWWYIGGVVLLLLLVPALSVAQTPTPTPLWEIDTEDAEAYYNRGNAYYDLGDYQRAIEDFNQTIEIDLLYAPAYLNRGIAYYYLGNYDQAGKNLKMYLILSPDAPNRAKVEAAIEKLKSQQ